MRYNLPLNDNYTIINSYYTGGLENGCTCDNCNKPIANVAEIQNASGQTFNVGMDCAKTLSNIIGLYNAEIEFAEMKALVAKVNKAKKEGTEIIFEILDNGEMACRHDRFILFGKSLDFSRKYLPMYLSKVVNPQKIGYVPFKTEIDLGFDRFMPRDNKDFQATLIVDNFTCFISVQPYFHTVTHEVSGYDLYLQIPRIDVSKRVTMYSGLKNQINWAINRHYFELYTNL